MSDSHNDVKCLSSPKARNEPKSPDCKPDSPRKSDITLEGEVFKLPNPYYKIKQPPRKKLASEKKSPNYGKCDKKSTSKSLSPRSSSSSSSTKTCSSQFTYKKGKQECIKNPFASPTSPKIPLDELTLMYLKIVEGRDLGLSTPIPITEIEPEKVSLVDLGVDINDEQLKEVRFLLLKCINDSHVCIFSNRFHLKSLPKIVWRVFFLCCQMMKITMKKKITKKTMKIVMRQTVTSKGNQLIKKICN